MTVDRDAHEDHGATFREVAGREFPAEYGRPQRTHRAVRNAVGVTEHAFDVLVVAGEDRHAFVDAAVTSAAPTSDGEGCYALCLDGDGRVAADCYVFATGDSLLAFLPLGEGRAVADAWRDRIAAGDREVSVTLATDDFGTFGVHGPSATEKVASVLHGASPPEDALTFVRGEMEAGVTVVRDDDLAGEEGYLVVCDADGASEVFHTLLVRGMNAPPFGRETWETLTLEAGTPLFDSELADREPAALGLENAVDPGDHQFVGRDALADGQADRRLVGLEPDELPDAGATVFADGAAVGAVTRAAVSPMREVPIAFAVVDADVTPVGETPADSLRVETADDDTESAVDAAVATLPFVDSGTRSARIPSF